MKNTFLVLLYVLTTLSSYSQKGTYDMVDYTLPAVGSWTKDEKNSFVTFTHINAQNNWCQIIIYKATASAGTIDADFNAEWNDLTAKDLSITSGPKRSPVKKTGQWTSVIADGKAVFDGLDMFIRHQVVTGFGNRVSIIGKTNSSKFLSVIGQVNNSVRLRNPSAASTAAGVNGNRSPVKEPLTNATGKEASVKFQFENTNWDDGWITTSSENWAAVTKGNIRALIHYPNKQADAYHSVLKQGLQNAWDLLVAPRYSNIRNYELKPVQSFESIAFAEADATEKLTGSQVHIVLFKKHFSNGNGRYIEFITTDKRAYEQEFGAYHNDEFGWDKVSNMQNRNRFAVAATDLAGKWSGSDYASLSYYYVNSGGFAGATATSISNEFTFFNTGKYESDHAGASGVVGNQKFARQVYKGDFTVNNWDMELKNRFEGASEKYSCYFEAVKGGRILIMIDRQGSVLSLVRQNK
ncbi:hypothetical protein LZZ85_17060 [Terrimonas sp. NA20]|uniref:DUF3472 domain-containing protein n=1 Tax=Terrimonas ginsenosidimutans TaxID=2908004 RepID=A0ABS9KUL1_9BACT|nr:hypothetical protein [Terrimonas ginsenosidimutans]MCG2616010.1 hypothetical protein [Terrimonas ginsenosidimutans]